MCPECGQSPPKSHKRRGTFQSESDPALSRLRRFCLFSSRRLYLPLQCSRGLGWVEFSRTPDSVPRQTLRVTKQTIGWNQHFWPLWVPAVERDPSANRRSLWLGSTNPITHLECVKSFVGLPTSSSAPSAQSARSETCRLGDVVPSGAFGSFRHNRSRSCKSTWVLEGSLAGNFWCHGQPQDGPRRSRAVWGLKNWPKSARKFPARLPSGTQSTVLWGSKSGIRTSRRWADAE